MGKYYSEAITIAINIDSVCTSIKSTYIIVNELIDKIPNKNNEYDVLASNVYNSLTDIASKIDSTYNSLKTVENILLNEGKSIDKAEALALKANNDELNNTKNVNNSFTTELQ